MVISSFVCVQFCISMLQKSAFWYQSSTEITGICMTESLSWFWRSQVTCVWLVMLVNVYTLVFSLLWMWLFFNTSLIVRVTWWVQCENLWDQWERWAAGEILSLTVWASPVAFGTVLSSCLMQDLSCTFLLFPSSAVQKWGGKRGFLRCSSEDEVRNLHLWEAQVSALSHPDAHSYWSLQHKDSCLVAAPPLSHIVLSCCCHCTITGAKGVVTLFNMKSSRCQWMLARLSYSHSSTQRSTINGNSLLVTYLTWFY